jgi:hypothetical protein
MDTTLLYNLVIRENTQMLKNLSAWLNKAAEHAKSKENGDVATLLSQRLVFDQFPLLKQIQSTCDSAKFAAARLTGKEPPKHPDTETTFEQLQTRIQSVIAYLNTYKPEDFKNTATQKIQQSWMQGKYLEPMDYLTQMALPNFFFHATTAYAIMRANGVDIGKEDFIGELNFRQLDL